MVEHSKLIFDKNDYYLSEKDLHLIIAKHVETVKHSLPFFNTASSSSFTCFLGHFISPPVTGQVGRVMNRMSYEVSILQI